jgi:diguanylate cyclase (GGDEF)-like protein
VSLLDVQPQSLTARQLDLFLDAARRIADELQHHYSEDLVGLQSGEIRRTRDEWAALEQLALTDGLTGLLNRHAGEQALEREAALARRACLPLSLVLIDLDHFKEVNDSYGHAAGDDVLREVSRILTRTFRASDLAVRWGGDEFLVLLPDVPLEGARVFAERARLQLAMLTWAESGHITMSAGVVQLQANEGTGATVQRADAQLYHAKRSGRNRVSANASEEPAAAPK